MGIKNKKAGDIGKKTWDMLAKKDAKFYSLVKEGGWDKDEFSQVGYDQWEKFKKLLSNYELSDAIGKEKIALDMGCGAGRVTFAMAKDFLEVKGVDVSGEMIKKAKEYQKDCTLKNVEFLTNNGVDLSLFTNNSFNFVFSYITLQHCLSSQITLDYIEEFSRILKPKGVCLFQLRVAPTFYKYVKSIISGKVREVKNIFFDDSCLHRKAFIGSWVYSPSIYRILYQNFSSSCLIVAPFEVYKNDIWTIKNEDSRWKRTFVIAIK